MLLLRKVILERKIGRFFWHADCILAPHVVYSLLDRISDLQRWTGLGRAFAGRAWEMDCRGLYSFGGVGVA
jgi:hypothetical protein